MRSKKILIFVCVLLATISIAYTLGIYGADLKQKWEQNKKRRQSTEAVLKQMGNTIEVGGYLPNSILEDLNGNSVKLSDITCSKSLIVFSLPGCGYSIRQLQSMKACSLSTETEKCFILISDENPFELMYIREQHGLQCTILHDRDRVFMKSLGIFTSPFNVCVDKDLRILDIMGGSLSSNEIKEYFPE
ncbi:MAG: redoxin domain-containing protein [Candidatus Zixiibacteriota bacterium]